MKDELQYQGNMRYVGKLLKLRYDNAMRLWGEMQCNSTLYYRVNLTTGVMEEYKSNSEFFKEKAIEKSYQKQLQQLVCMIEDEEEREIIQKTLDREHLIETFEQGEWEVAVEYRRKFGNNDFRWVKCEIKMVLEPVNLQIIAFGNEREIPETWMKRTTSKMLLNSLYKATNNMHFYVIAINYTKYTYDIIQSNIKNREDVNLRGSITKLIDKMYKLYNENSYDFIELLRDGNKIQKELYKKKKIVYEIQVRDTKYAKYTWLEHRILPAEDNLKDCNYYLLLIVDITERKVREETLRKALEKSEQAGRAKLIFLSHMSHEIRTPLNGIMGMIRLIQEEPGMEHNEYLKNAIVSSKHLKLLLNDILDIARIECGKFRLHKSWMTEYAFFNYINIIIEPIARERGIHISYHHKNRFQAIYVDIARLQQIMINLLTNAIKYNYEGGTVTLSVDMESLHDNYKKIYFCVEDNGKGMSKKFQKRAFEPFEQEVQSDIATGTGLGLTIAKLLVTLMGGTIIIKSKVNVGTKITVAIEAFARNDYKKIDICTERKELPDVYQKKHCLLVEDNEMNIEIVAAYLKEIGISVDTAMIGLDAVKLFSHSSEYYYDIIFMDIILPDISGMEVAGKIRNMQRKDAMQIPIVAMTANVFSEDIHRIYASGMNYHLLKPFDKNELYNIVRKEFTCSVDE